jgi:hypothetical protein
MKPKQQTKEGQVENSLSHLYVYILLCDKTIETLQADRTYLLHMDICLKFQ